MFFPWELEWICVHTLFFVKTLDLFLLLVTEPKLDVGSTAFHYTTEIVALKYFSVNWPSACRPWGTSCCGHGTSFSVCVTEKHYHFAQPTCNNFCVFSVYYEIKGLNNSTSSGWSLHIAWPGSSIITTPLSHANCGSSLLLVWVKWTSKMRRISAVTLGLTVATKLVSHCRNNPLFL
jgi:hypothetical protein